MNLHKISEIYPTLPLTEYDFAAKYRAGFAASELGRIRALLPLSEMATVRYGSSSVFGTISETSDADRVNRQAS